jgi:hypothetical protein
MKNYLKTVSIISIPVTFLVSFVVKGITNPKKIRKVTKKLSLKKTKKNKTLTETKK